MKQFWKQLLAGMIGVLVLLLGGFVIYWIARGVIWLCGFVPVAEVVKNIPLIIMGFVILLVVELLGGYLLWCINRRTRRGRARIQRYPQEEYYEEEE